MPSTAKAGARGEALFGDFNADGLQDEAVLGAVLPNLCSTIVTYGAAPGVYTPPVAYTYLTLGGSSTPNCPDIGVAANVDDDPADELWVAWSQGAPATVDFNRLVLQPPSSPPRPGTPPRSPAPPTPARPCSAPAAGTAPMPSAPADC
ncbi:hypothetical protein [Plantactinospora veratri]